MAAKITVTSNTFDKEVLQQKGTVLVDFWATWCGPCKMLSPLVDQVAAENNDIKVCAVDVDEAQDLAMRYQISAIPTLLVFKDGQVTNRSVGFIPKAQILSLVK